MEPRHVQPQSSEADHSGDTDGVIPLLSALLPAYLRRVAPDGMDADTRRDAPDAMGADDIRLERAFRPCEAEAVVTIDAERRIAWPASDLRPATTSLRAVGDWIEVSAIARPGGHVRALDRRGRLRIPTGLLAAANLGPGNRVLITREPDGWLLVPVDRVAIAVAG